MAVVNNIPQECIPLPKDTIFHIMSMIRRIDLYSCKYVSKLWYKVASDPYFGWFPIVGFMLPESQNIETAPRYIQKRETETTKKQFKCELDYHELKNWQVISPVELQDFTDLRNYNLQVNIKGKSVYIVQGYIKASLNKTPQYYLNLCKKYPKLFQYEYCEINRIMIAEVNLRHFEKLVENKETEPEVNKAILNIMENDNDMYFRNYFSHLMKNSSTQKVNDAPARQPIGLKHGLNLYKYQLDAVQWMKSVENINTVSYTNLQAWRSSKSALFANFGNRQFVPTSEIKDFVFKFHPKGGILADEVGLGKTMEMIALMLASPGNNLLDEENGENEKKQEKEKEKEQGKEKAKVKDETENDDKDNDSINKLRFKTNANLVVCPGHLCKQWYNEISTKTTGHLLTIVVTTVTELKAFTHADFVYADVVIISVQLLKSSDYRFIKIATQTPASKFPGANQFEKNIRAIRAEPKRGMNVVSPMVEYFVWHRIILDEAHEIAEKFISYIYPLQSDKWWYVSATPFPNSTIYDSALEILDFPKWNYPIRLYGLLDYMANNLLWRNTKESVKNEYQIPPVVHDVLLLDYTDVENFLYKEGQIGVYIKYSTNILEASLTSTKNKLEEKKEAWIRCHDSKHHAYEEVSKKLQEMRQLHDYDDSHDDLLVPFLDNFFEQEPEILTKQEKEKKTEKEESEVSAEKASQIAALSFKQQLGDVGKLKVAELRDALKKRAIAIPSQATKATLVKLLQDAMVQEDNTKNNNNKNKNKSENEDNGKSKSEKGRKKKVEEEPENKKEEKTTGRGRGNKRKTAEEEVEDNTTTSSRRGKKAKKDNNNNNNNNNNTMKSPFQERQQNRIMDQKLTRYIIEHYGTKFASLVMYLRSLWKENPHTRVIIFATSNVTAIAVNLAEFGEIAATVEGNILKRTNAINKFIAKESPLRVVVMGLTVAASGTNLHKADHVIFFDQIYGVSAQQAIDIETQAIGRAHRQGQTNQVVVTKLILRNTSEHSQYLKCQEYKMKCLGDVTQVLVRTNSVENIIANSPSLQKSGSVQDLLAAQTQTLGGKRLSFTENESDKESESESESESEETK